MNETPTPELSRIIKLSELGDAARTGEITADDAELTALAKRFALPEISSLNAEYKLNATGDNILFSGALSSRLNQSCSISGQPFPVAVDETFKIIFAEQSETGEGNDEIELASEDCDIIEFETMQIDIGEAIAQTLYLALDPYPRGPNADETKEKSGLMSPEEAGPFGALAALKGKTD